MSTEQVGYKMRRIKAVMPQGNKVAVHLECDHIQLWKTYLGETVEEKAARLRNLIGVRQRCEACRNKEEAKQ